MIHDQPSLPFIKYDDIWRWVKTYHYHIIPYLGGKKNIYSSPISRYLGSSGVICHPLAWLSRCLPKVFLRRWDTWRKDARAMEDLHSNGITLWQSILNRLDVNIWWISLVILSFQCRFWWISEDSLAMFDCPRLAMLSFRTTQERALFVEFNGTFSHPPGSTALAWLHVATHGINLQVKHGPTATACYSYTLQYTTIPLVYCFILL